MEERKIVLRPGEYKIPFDEYRAIDAVNNSSLGLLKISPAHYLAGLSQQRKETPALRFGKALHCLLLEPELFEAQFAILDPRKRRSKESSVTELTNSEGVQLRNIEKAFRKHSYVQHLLNGAQRELTIVWNDCSPNSDLPILCKGRIDACLEINGVKTLIDLKTTTSATLGHFQTSLFKYGYYRQAAFYLEGCEALDSPAKHYIIIAIESEYPHGIRIFRITNESIALGKKHNRELLELYRDCKFNNDWHGYKEEVIDISVPDWALQMEVIDE